MDLLKIVSKECPIDKKYIPDGLMNEPIANTWIIKDVYYQFYAMNQELQKNGMSSLKIISGYRCYEYQRMLYNQKLKENIFSTRDRQIAKEATDKYITFPGFSEHQLGLAIDVTTSDKNIAENALDAFGCSLQLRWLLKNSTDYGFVLRYPRHKVDLTGVEYKPYHYRYVGVNHAKKMKRLDLCLEEYVAKQNRLTY